MTKEKDPFREFNVNAEMCWPPIQIGVESAVRIIETQMHEMMNRFPHDHYHPQDELNLLSQMWSNVFEDMEREFYRIYNKKFPE